MFMTHITNSIKKETFDWPKTTVKAVKEIKEKMTQTLVLRLPDFSKIFEATCNTFNVSISDVSSQDDNPITFFSEQLNEVRLK